MFLHRCLLASLLGTGLFALPAAHAQVVRCTDAQGRVTYTEGTCPEHQKSREVLPELSAQERAEQDAQYQQALENKRAAQQAQSEREAAQAQEAAQRAAAEAARRPPPAPIVVVPPAPAVSSELPIYGPLYPPRPPRPPHVRPPPHPVPPPPAPSPGYNCNVFRCYDGKGNTWQRP